MSQPMKVSKWGNSLAVRLPAELVRELGLKEGDYVAQDKLALYKAKRNLTRQEAIELLRRSRWDLPAGYAFDRDEANSR